MSTTRSQPDRHAIAEHLAALHQCAEGANGVLVLASFGAEPLTDCPLPPMVEHFTIGDVEKMTDRAMEWTVQLHRNVYAPLVVMRADLSNGKKGDERDIVKVLGLVADFDDADAIQWASRSPIPPTAILETSPRRFQTFYLFDRPLTVETAKDLARRLQAHTQCDFGTKDLSHVWRIGGTLNWPNKKKLDAGRAPEPCLVVEVPGGSNAVIDPAALDAALPVLPAPVNNRTTHRPVQPVHADDLTLLDRMLHAKNGAKIQALWNGDWHAHPSPSEADLALASHLAFYCGRDPSRVDRLFRQSGLMREKWNTRRGDTTYGDETVAQACAQCRETYTPPSRPVVTEEAPAAGMDEAPLDAKPLEQLELDCDIGDLDKITRRAWAAIYAGNTPTMLFLYGSASSRIEMDDDKQRLRLVPLTPDRLRFHAAKLARWTKLKPVPFTKKADWQRVECRPPMDVIYNMLAAPEIALPILSRIVEVPVFSDRGTLVQCPGYDAEAQLYYQPYAADMTVSVSTDPTAAEVATAKAQLDDVLADFPLVSEADRTHAVALAVVPFVRDLIDGPTPLHVVEAASPGSGKNLLVAAMLSASVGRRIGVIAEARDDDEWRKRLTARLREGCPITLIDNLSRPLDSGTVSAVLTARRWEDRLLGKTETVAVPVRTIFVATANNPILSMEIARRSIRIRLDPKMDRPWMRDGFRHPDLGAFVEQERPALIVALLTLVQAWLKAGRPKPAAKPLGSFEAWSTVVGGIVEFAGYQHFLGNALEFYEAADSEGMLWRLFVSSWWDTYQGQTVSVKELYDIATAIDGFYLGRGSSERGQKTVLGHSLKKHRDQIVGCFRVQEAGTYGNGVQWRLLQIATPVLKSTESVESLTLT